jgi:hypothetical protein
MTSKFTNVPQTESPTFPGLYQHINGFIVLATDETTGTVVNAGTKKFPLGYYSFSWVKFSDKTEWTQVWGTIEFVKD